MKPGEKWSWLWILVLSLLACNAFGSAPPSLPPPTPLATETAVSTQPPAPTITVAPTVAAPAGEPIRISFARGAVSAQVTGSLSANGSVTYAFRALANQPTTITLESADSAANFALTSPSGQPLKRIVNEDRIYELTLPETGDYRLEVQSVTAVSYTLTLTILPPP